MFPGRQSAHAIVEHATSDPQDANTTFQMECKSSQYTHRAAIPLAVQRRDVSRVCAGVRTMLGELEEGMQRRMYGREDYKRQEGRGQTVLHMW